VDWRDKQRVSSGGSQREGSIDPVSIPTRTASRPPPVGQTPATRRLRAAAAAAAVKLILHD